MDREGNSSLRFCLEQLADPDRQEQWRLGSHADYSF